MAGPLSIGNNVILDLNTFAAACFAVVLGSQLLTFGAVARLFAARAGFLPRTKRADYLIRWISTDRLVQFAAILLVPGGIGLVWATWQWMQVGFGPLDSSLVPRVLVSSFCAIVVAIQTAGFAFLLGVLEIPFRSTVYPKPRAEVEANRLGFRREPIDSQVEGSPHWH
jgi:hypothetical protein